MKITNLSGDSVLYETAKGALRITHLSPGISLHVSAGILTPEFGRIVTEDGEKALARARRCTFFVDGYDSKHVATEFREEMTAWFKKHSDEDVGAVMLVRSKVIELAANVLNLFVGKQPMKVHSTPAAWEQACRQIFPTFRRAPLEWPIRENNSRAG